LSAGAALTNKGKIGERIRCSDPNGCHRCSGVAAYMQNVGDVSHNQAIREESARGVVFVHAGVVSGAAGLGCDDDQCWCCGVLDDVKASMEKRRSSGNCAPIMVEFGRWCEGIRRQAS
jgi:hypothetical protein